MLSWTTHLDVGGPERERTIPGVQLDPATLGGFDIAQARRPRVVLEASSAAELSDDVMPDLVEFFDLAARTLQTCARGSAPWSAMVVQVRTESGSMSATLVDDADPFARSGASVLLLLGTLEAAAWDLGDPEEAGWEQANERLKQRVRHACRVAAGGEPARAAIADFKAATGCALLLDLVGQFDAPDFEPFPVD